MRAVGETVFNFVRGGDGRPTSTLRRRLAGELGLKESWLQAAVAENPDLVMGPCAAAGLDDDRWYLSEREYGTEGGPIDVLLVSDGGRLAIVETKLSYNPEGRRTVMAQVVDYAVHLRDALRRRPPELPSVDGKPVVTMDDVWTRLAEDDPLLVIASDNLGDRIERLASGMLAGRNTGGWELVFVDVALYTGEQKDADTILAVPNLRGVIKPDYRATVRVLVEGDVRGFRVESVEVPTTTKDPQTREKWDADRFFAALDVAKVSPSYRDLARALASLTDRWPALALSWGSGKTGSLSLKRNGAGIAELYGEGFARFRPEKFETALGPSAAAWYREQLAQLFPRALEMSYPFVPVQEAGAKAARLGAIVVEALEKAEAPS